MSTLFPYTTLFRSGDERAAHQGAVVGVPRARCQPRSVDVDGAELGERWILTTGVTETFLVAELDAEGEYGIEVRDVLVDWIGEVEGCRLDGRPRLPAIQDGHALAGIK